MIPNYIKEKKLSELLPQLNLIARFYKLKINRYKDFSRIVDIFVSRLN